MAIHMRYVGDGVEYAFDAPGDGLPMHIHGLIDQHDVTVLQGSVLVYGPRGVRLQRACAGTTVHFDALDAHEVMALEAGTKVFNRFLLGVPPAIAALPESERSGHYDSRLTHQLSEAGLPVLKELP